MTDKEIIQALRCYAKGLGHDDACENCKVGEIQDRREYIEFAAANVIERLAANEDTGLSPEKVSWMKEVVEAAFDNDTSRIERAHNLHVADKEGRVVVLPCKVGERWVDEDGRAVRITAVIASREPFGENINIYFDYEDATPDDAGSDCMTNWYHFSRRFTGIEVERAMEDKKDG